MEKIRVLCVDEYELMLLTMQHLLEFEGWEVVTACHGADACALIESAEGYDAVVIDERVSGTSGSEILRRLRALPHRRRTPAIIFAPAETEAELRAAGADAVLQKPNDIKGLAETIARFLRAGRRPKLRGKRFSESHGRVSHAPDCDDAEEPAAAAQDRAAAAGSLSMTLNGSILSPSTTDKRRPQPYALCAQVRLLDRNLGVGLTPRSIGVARK